MDDLNELRTFVRVAEAGNFAEAARSLGVTASSASKAVRRLEQKLGTRLLTRTTRSVVRTEEGARFLIGAKQLLEDADALRNALSDSTGDPRGKLLISAPEAFGRMWMTERVLKFMRRYKNIEVELTFDDRVADLVTEGIDIAVRVGDLSDSPNLISRKFFEDRIYTLASQAYLDRQGVPQTPAQLAGHRAVHYRNRNTGRLVPFQFTEGDEVITVEFDPHLVANSIYTLEQAGAAGIGIVQLPGIVAINAIGRGDLVEILAEHRTGRLQYSLVYPERRLLPARVKAFAEFLFTEPPDPRDFRC